MPIAKKVSISTKTRAIKAKTKATKHNLGKLKWCILGIEL